MAQFQYYYDVNLRKGPVLASMGVIHYDDSGANAVVLYVYNGENVADLSAGTVSGIFVRADGSTITVTGSVSTAGNHICYAGLTTQCYTIPGPFKFYIKWQGSATVTLFAGFGDVAPTDTGVIGSTVVTNTVSSLISQINAATASIPATYTALLNMVASEYSTTAIYKAGQIVRHGNYLYIRNADATAVEASFVSSNWTSINVGNDAVMGVRASIGDPASLPDADNAVNNRIYVINDGQDSANYILHLPYVCAYGVLMTFSSYHDYTGFAVQLFFRHADPCTAWYRFKTSNGWSVWSQVLTDTDISSINQVPESMIAPDYSATKIYKKGEYVKYNDTLYCRTADATAAEPNFTAANWFTRDVSTAAVMLAGHTHSLAELSDADNAVPNRIYTINWNQTSTEYVANLPYAGAVGTLITLASSTESTYGQVQLFHSIGHRYDFYKRIKYAVSGSSEYVWSDWVQLYNNNDFSVSNHTLSIG